MLEVPLLVQSSFMPSPGSPLLVVLLFPRTVSGRGTSNPANSRSAAVRTQKAKSRRKRGKMKVLIFKDAMDGAVLGLDGKG